MYFIRKLIENNSDFTLEKLMEVKIQDYSEKISDVSRKSTIELGLDNVLHFHKIIIVKESSKLYFLCSKAIQNIKGVWSSTNLQLEPYKDKGIYYVIVDDDIFQSLEDHLVQLSAIKASKYIIIYY